jgi:hypothetical protein
LESTVLDSFVKQRMRSEKRRKSRHLTKNKSYKNSIGTRLNRIQNNLALIFIKKRSQKRADKVYDMISLWRNMNLPYMHQGT